MRNRSPLQSLASSPTMVGAVTTLIVIVAVFLAYNANNGLPFVPTYRVSVEVPNAARLSGSNEVRIGGHRVGVVESIEPIRTEESQTTAAAGPDSAADVAGDTGGIAAQLNLKLDKSAQPLPQDSIFRVRYRSSFGLKYLEIVRGTGEPAPEGFVFDGLDDAGTCKLPTEPETFTTSLDEPAKNGCFQEQTEFDDINSTFDRPTRNNSRRNLEGFGDAFAGRGTSLNQTVQKLRPLFENLKPVAEVLNEPSTRFERFFPELADAARIVAPVAEEQAQLFTNMAITFDALSSDPAALKETISEGPPTLETGIETMPRQRVFLSHFTTLSRALRPGVADLPETLPVFNDAIEVGTPVLNRTPEMNRRLEGAFRALRRLVDQPTTKLALQRLQETFDSAKPLARHVVPAQTVCNYFDYWFISLPNGLSDRDQVGFNFRQAITGFPRGGTTIDSEPGPGTNQQTIPGEVATAEAGYAGYSSNGRTWDHNFADHPEIPDDEETHPGNPGDPGVIPRFDDRGDVFMPFENPILYGQAYGPSGQNYAGSDPDDCQGGQNGYELGRLPVPGQTPNNPAILASDLPGSRGPTQLFWTQDSRRQLRDSRVDSRQPATWEGLDR